MRDLLDSLQSWYAGHCDGQREHQFGVKIETLDNPGWIVEIDLSGTSLANKSFSQRQEERSPTNWIRCSSKNGVFTGAGGERNLSEIIELFLAWTETES